MDLRFDPTAERLRPMGTPKTQAYAILRLTLGIDMFLHGATRIASGASRFADSVVKEFQGTVLPAWAVESFALPLPFLELSIGLLLAFGLRTQAALVVGSLLMAVLVCGTALRSDWTTIGLQLVYAVVFYLLLSRVEDNGYSLDRLLDRSGSSAARSAG